MSYSFRDKPRTRLSDRLRGKSGDELLQELKQEFDKDRKMFFDSNPNWGFTPAGSAFPRRHAFDDDEDDVLRSNSRGRTDLRAHLDDLARRHPEFAEHLRSPPGWVSDFHSGGSSSSGAGGPSRETGGRYFEGTDGVSKGNSESTTKSETPQQQSSSQPDTDKSNQQTGQTYNSPRGSCSAADRDNLLQHGLRNTDPEIGLKSQAATKEDRNQRSMSAPPDGRTQFNSGDKPQRFVSKIEINPVNPATGETAASFSNSSDNSSGKPPMAPPKHPQQQPGQQPQPKTSNVRHIPIFVEGRDEPVLPKNLDQDFSNVPPSQPHNFSAPQQQPPQSYHYSTPPPQQPAQSQSQQFHPPPPPPPQPNKQPQPEQQQSHEKFQQSQQQPQASQPAAEKKQKTYNSNDPMFQMQQIHKDLEELRKQIDNYKGASRTDKEYVYLDEMLTRNLIKLDNIETDGKENIRAMRKETIRCVQQCINILESKVPQTPVVTPQTPLEFNSTNGENKMDVDENTKSETALTNNDGETGGNSLQQTSSNSKMDTSSDNIVKENTGDSGKNVQVDNTQSNIDNKNASVSTETSTDAVNKC